MGQLLCFLPIGCALLFLSEVTLCERVFVLLYPTTFLFLLPMWLIEQRYHLIPFAFFLAMREQRSPAAEVSLGIVFIMAALFAVYDIVHRFFFL